VKNESFNHEPRSLEDGAEGRPQRALWHNPYICEHSPRDPNLRQCARPQACIGCPLVKFVPDELQNENSPCWLMALNEKGETIDYLLRHGTQPELEEALVGWLRSQISRMDQQLATSK
jgi:hypothetical protein